MRVVIQLVKHASCTIDGEMVSSIEKGYCVLVGFNDFDTKEIVDKMVNKIVKLRIFMDENEKMNLSILDIKGSILSISQFTLYANCKKGNRPSFIEAAKPVVSSPLYDYFNEKLSEFVPVQTGVFGADMKIDLCNDGPITIVMDSIDL
ncbi:MAG: D-aminoacyl-tRNA deacylase [Floccifex sp.]